LILIVTLNILQHVVQHDHIRELQQPPQLRFFAYKLLLKDSPFYPPDYNDPSIAQELKLPEHHEYCYLSTFFRQLLYPTFRF